MRLFYPQLKRRSDGAVPQTNKFYGDVSDLFECAHKANVHFGINGANAYAVKLLRCDNVISPNTQRAEVEAALKAFFLHSEHLYEAMFFASRNMPYQIVIIYDGVNWTTENNYVITVEMSCFSE